MRRFERIQKYCKKNKISILKYSIDYIYSTSEKRYNSLKENIRNKTINKKNRARLTNKSFSIISINCNGCTISHDLGLRFNSQFVNLWLSPSDFLEYVKNMDYYNSIPLSFIKDEKYSHPVGYVDGLKIYFTHYLSESDARMKWEERKKRINKNNIFLMMTDQEGCTIEQMREFDALPYNNKVIFTHIPYKDIKSAFYIKGFENNNMVGKLNGWTGKFSIKKYYDQFDYVKWFNEGIIEQ